MTISACVRSKTSVSRVEGVCVCVCVQAGGWACTGVYVCVCHCACVQACVWACVRACACVCVYTCMCEPVSVCVIRGGGAAKPDIM